MRILQISDVHFGRHAIAAYLTAIARRIEAGRYDVVAVVGDLTQRNFRSQFRSAHAFLDATRRYASVINVPGNHDVAWWWKPVGLGFSWPMYRGYRKWVSDDLEPVLRLPGVTFVGLNSCHGVRPYTLTTRLRDLSVVGAVRPEQWEQARRAFAASPAGDLKVLVFHHNLLRGDLSNRWGLVNKAAGIDEAAATGADLVLNGHDHQTRIEEVRAGDRRLVVSHSTTLCERTRGGLPSAFQEIEVTPAEIRMRACVWTAAANDFTPREDRCFAR
ncbi:MAG: metallophosphoesterase family protein [Gemmatimonadaceae bacterium]